MNAVKIPDDIVDADARKFLLEEYGLEIGAGLGKFAGEAWRIGLMGHGCNEANVELCLNALKNLMSGESKRQNETVSAEVS